MSALRVSNPHTREVRLVPLPPYREWCALHDSRMVGGGWLAVACDHLSDPVPFTREGSFAGHAPRRKRLTEARRTNNREAAQRYRARRRAERNAA